MFELNKDIEYKAHMHTYNIMIILRMIIQIFMTIILFGNFLQEIFHVSVVEGVYFMEGNTI